MDAVQSSAVSRARDRVRAAVLAEITEAAIQLLDERGFDETTVDDLAKAAGISARTFFRYFPSKEDVVFGELAPLGQEVRDALNVRPPEETPWQALRGALQVMVDLADADVARALRVTRIASSTPALRARNLEKHNDWAGLLAPLVAVRLDTGGDSHIRSEALVYSALACLDVALNTWAKNDGRRSLGELLDIAFDTLTD